MRFLGLPRISLSRFDSLRLGFTLFLGLGAIFILVGYPNGSITQPIAFNHSKHVESGLACVDCHEGVQTQAHATLPSLDKCLLCHQMALTESAEEEKVRTIAETDGEINWKPVTRVPTHVYFSHRRHVALAGLECATCHGPMEQLTAPPQRPYYAISMDTCIECHEESQARTDCDDCHR